MGTDQGALGHHAVGRHGAGVHASAVVESGYPVDRDYVETVRDVLTTYQETPSLKESCGYVWRAHLDSGRLRKTGDLLVQPELARLLRGITSEGPDLFYLGPVAQAMARDMKRHGGLITEKEARSILKNATAFVETVMTQLGDKTDS